MAAEGRPPVRASGPLLPGLVTTIRQTPSLIKGFAIRDEGRGRRWGGVSGRCTDGFGSWDTLHRIHCPSGLAVSASGKEPLTCTWPWQPFSRRLAGAAPESGLLGVVCCGVRVYHLEPTRPEPQGQLQLSLPSIWVVPGGWAWWGSQWPGLLEALLMSVAPGATARAEFWLRPWVGPEGHVQGLCPGQPGARVWG